MATGVGDFLERFLVAVFAAAELADALAMALKLNEM